MGPRGYGQTAYQILVASSEDVLSGDRGDLWDSGKVASDQSINISYGGRKLRSGERYHWKVRIWDQRGNPTEYSEPSWWEMGLLEPSDWKAEWMELPYPIEEFTEEPAPATMFRTEFRLESPVARARAYVSALGLYELHMNGERVGHDLLTPGWTDYRKRVQYQTHDVTELLRLGGNAVGAICAEGWYAGRLGFDPKRGQYGKRPRFLLQLEIELSDGTRRMINSDEAWRASIDGPIRSASLLDGEVYDSTRAMAGWDSAGYDDANWGSAVCTPWHADLVAQYAEPIRVTLELRSVKVTEPSPGTFVFDMGQNMVGWCRLKVRGDKGTEVKLRHAEVLNPDGSIYTENLRTAKQTDTYVLGGEGEEVLEPHFTFHGFRYVEVIGLSSRPEPSILTGCVIHSDAPVTGTFLCSDPGLNKLMENILWTQRGNMVGIPTDCPQRDERLGWMGDAQTFCQTSCLNMSMAKFYTKWLGDVRDAQSDDGRFSDFAPNPWEGKFLGAPAWGDAGVIVPWRMYENYGDIQILERHFEPAKRWIEYIRSRNPDLIWRSDRGNDYGDWLHGDTLRLEGWPTGQGETPKDVFATAFLAYSTAILAKMASLIGSDEAEALEALSNQVKAAFRRAYVEPDGRIKGDTQTSYALALHFDLLPNDLCAAALNHMLEGIAAYDGYASTGFHGTYAMMSELVRWGQAKVAYQLLTNDGIPSWRYMIDHGATTIWERWDGYVEGRGFQDAGMNSFNHYAFGSVGEWIYRNVAGINPDPEVPGYKRFVIRPRLGGGLTFARAEYDSLHGRTVCSWRRNDGFTLDMVVPANTTALVYLPTPDPRDVTEGGMDVDLSEGVRFLRIEDRCVVLEVLSGTYRFVTPATHP